ncbi:MAG: X-Pro dipeptidyl-peptidase C-terminal domain protein [Mycobacterium sp.]|nr:X-Pro dipeptidyl-peptidase C-terminal domain protein [Mycobacterium sp.]
MEHNGSDRAWYDAQPPRPEYRGMRSYSRYLTMRDGVRIAVNVYLPAGAASGARLPAILNQTRYYRAMELRRPLRTALMGKPFHHIPATVRSRTRFVAGGYAWVDVDVRGSGASYGHRLCEWSPDEIRDGAEIVDWIVSRPWSNGKVGALGSSYSGAAAEFLLVNRHPAVRAVAPRFSPFDAYTDIAFPGGIHAAWFTETWGRYNAALDRNAPHEIAGWWVKLLVTGVLPVQGDHDRSLRAGAIAAHGDNYDIHGQAKLLTFRDDVAPSDPYHQPGGAGPALIGTPIDQSGSINLFSPHNYWHDVEASGAAVYSYSGWFDGAYPNSAIKRFLTLSSPGSRLILGPWSHGGSWHIEPFRGPAKSRFDHEGELLRFFDHHLRESDTGISSEPRVHYFTMGEGRWKSADAWPPPAATLTYYLAADRLLGVDAPASDSGADEYVVDHTVGTGEHSRWRTQVAVGEAVRYPERTPQDVKLLTYTSAALDGPLEVTGHPVVTLCVSTTASDATLFVYLEDVDDRGHVAYVTEGQLRATNRRLSDAPAPYRQSVPYRTFKRSDAQPLITGQITELTLDLVPTSYLFRAGHRIRIAVAGADASHFAILPGTPPTLAVHRGRLNASRIDLPVIRSS